MRHLNSLTGFNARRAASGGGGTPPATNLWDWLDATAAYTDAGATTLCSASGVDLGYTLKDLTLNSRSPQQATSGNRPTWFSNEQNGLPCLRFDGTDNYMEVAATLAQPVTIHMVIKPITWTSGAYILSTNTSTGLLVAQRTTTPQVHLYGGSSFIPEISPTLGATALMSFVVNGASSVLKLNNDADVTGSGGTGGIVDGITLATNAGSFSTFSSYDFFEMLFYSSAQATESGDGLLARQYLNSKYNLGLGI